jgi:predicted Fe-S protein YdhL (DUF1289 family)
MVQSPCVKICELNEDGVCVGCGRDRAEIAGWKGMSEADRSKTVESAAERLWLLSRRDKKTRSSK